MNWREKERGRERGWEGGGGGASEGERIGKAFLHWTRRRDAIPKALEYNNFAAPVKRLTERETE